MNGNTGAPSGVYPDNRISRQDAQFARFRHVADEAHRGATMFESSLIASTTVLQPQRRGATLAAVALQLAAAAVVVMLPLLHPELLPHGAPSLALTLPPRMKPPQPVPQPRPHLVATAATSLAAPAPLAATAASAPRLTGPSLGHADPVPGPPTAGSLNLGDGGRSSISSLGAVTGTGSSPNIAVAAATPNKPLRISGGVSAGLLLEPIHAFYPAIARAAHVSGTVIVEAVISRAGRIEQAHIVSGPPMLQGAALEAIQQARYHPYLLNGEPTEVDTTFTVNFEL